MGVIGVALLLSTGCTKSSPRPAPTTTTSRPASSADDESLIEPVPRGPRFDELQRTVTACGLLSAARASAALGVDVRAVAVEPLGGGSVCEFRPAASGAPAKVLSLFVFFTTPEDPSVTGSKAYLRFRSEAADPVKIADLGNRAFYADGRLGVLRDDIYFDLTAVGFDLSSSELRQKLTELATPIERALRSDRVTS